MAVQSENRGRGQYIKAEERLLPSAQQNTSFFPWGLILAEGHGETWVPEGQLQLEEDVREPEPGVHQGTRRENTR